MRDEFRGMIDVDHGSPDGDHTGLWVSMGGNVCCCTLPRHLGNIIGFRIVRGRMIAETESGADFVVPEFKIEGVRYEDGGKK